jgi:hypothetical protein
MTRNLSYYSNLCEERTAEFTDQHQKEYKLDVLKSLINTLKWKQQGGTTILPDEFFMILHDIFQFMPKHERYFATFDKDRMKLYFEKVAELQERLSIPNGYFEYTNQLKKQSKKLMDVVLPTFIFCHIFLGKYSIFNIQIKEIVFWLFTAVFIGTKAYYYWKIYQWKKSKL